MIINHNMSAMFTHRQGFINNENLSKDMQKLASGKKINFAKDDAAGLAVAEKMSSQIRGLQRANKNVQDGISFLQTAEGYLAGTTSVLQRVRELSIQAANGVYSAEDRGYIQGEVSQLIDEVSRIASSAQFNGMNILTGRFAMPNEFGNGYDSMFIHMGANMDQRRQVYIGDMTAEALGLKEKTTGQALTVSTIESANIALGLVDVALGKLNKQRADLGAYQTRLEFSMNFLAQAAENLQSAESRIRDADMAEVSVDLSRDNILLQTSTAMLAQANQKSNLVLQLLQ